MSFTTRPPASLPARRPAGLGRRRRHEENDARDLPHGAIMQK